MDIKSEDLISVLTLCNSLKLATVCLSLDKYITDVNFFAQQLFIYPKEQLLYKPLHLICRELGVDSPLSPTTMELVSPSTIHVLSEKLVDVHWSLSRCLDDEEHCTGYMLVGKIIMTRFVSQPQVQMEKVLRALPCAVFSKDINSHYSVVNQYLANVSGFSSEIDMVGKTDYDTPWVAEAEILRKADQLAMNDNSTIVVEEVITLSNGRKEAFLATKSPFLDENGRLLGIIGTSVIISQQKKTHCLNDPSTSLQNPSSKIYLSKKEIECVNWMIKGKTSAEMATIMTISKRTVEAHMNSIKKKLNCYKQFQVGYLVGKYGYLLL